MRGWTLFQYVTVPCERQLSGGGYTCICFGSLTAHWGFSPVNNRIVSLYLRVWESVLRSLWTHVSTESSEYPALLEYLGVVLAGDPAGDSTVLVRDNSKIWRCVNERKSLSNVLLDFCHWLSIMMFEHKGVRKETTGCRSISDFVVVLLVYVLDIQVKRGASCQLIITSHVVKVC